MRMISLAVLAFIATPLAAQGPSAQPQDTDPITVTGKKVCRWETPIGSNMRQRICMTVADAKSKARENERRTQAYIHDKANMSARTKPCSNC